MMTCNPDLGYIPDPETWSGKNEKFENYNTPNLVASIPGSIPFEHFIEGMDEMNFDILELRADGGKYQGLYIDYFNNLIKLEKGLKSVDFVTRSQSSSFLLPSSSYDAAARDVQVGVSDIAVGSFWMTPKRLLWTAVTTPLFEDEIRLVVKMNSNGPQKFIDMAKKVISPVEGKLWVLVFVLLLLVTCLSIAFASPKVKDKRTWVSFRNLKWKEANYWGRLRITVAQVFESFLEMFINFCGLSVEMDYEASMPYKLLMIWWSIFICLFLSAYVANLASFLTDDGAQNTVNSILDVIASDMRICTDLKLKRKLQIAWPNANFLFYEFNSILSAYENEKCEVLAISYADTLGKPDYVKTLCDFNLAYTKDIFIHVTVGFPINAKFAAGFSRLMKQGEENGVKIDLDNFEEQAGKILKDSERICNLWALEEGSNDLVQLSIENLFIPLAFFFLCASVAVILKLRSIRRGDFKMTIDFSLQDLTDDRKQHRPTSLVVVPIVVDENFTKEMEETLVKSVCNTVGKLKKS